MPTPRNLSTLEKIATTWGEVESPILAFAACGLNFGIRGVHGNAKTTVATLIARALGKEDVSNLEKADIVVSDTGVRVIYADKASIISLAGLPDMDESRKVGELTFIKNKKSVMGDGVVVIFIDELTRAPKETQNHLLEIIESKTLLGHKLHHALCISSFNPDTYKGAVKLDAALLDRFVAVVPVSDFTECDTAQFERMIEINQTRTNDDVGFQRKLIAELRGKFTKIKTQYDAYLKMPDLLEKVRSYCAAFLVLAVPKVKSDDNKILISGREIGNHMWKALLALSAYYQSVLGRSESQALIEASDDVLGYCFITKHGMEGNIVNHLKTIQADTRFILAATAKGEGGKLQTAYSKAMSLQAKIDFWKQNSVGVVKHLTEEDQMEMMEHTLNKVVEEERKITSKKDAKEKSKETVGQLTQLLKVKTELYAITSAHKEFESITDRVEGALLCDIVYTMQNADVDITQNPYKSLLSKPETSTSDLVDMIVSLKDNVLKV